MANIPRNLTQSSGETLVLDRTRLVLSFNSEQTREQASVSLARLGLVLEDDGETDERRALFERVNHSPNRFWVRSADGHPIDEQKRAAIEASDVSWVGAVYRTQRLEARRAYLCPLPHVLLIRTDRYQVLQRTLTAFGLSEVTEKTKYLTGYRYFIVSNPKGKNAYEIRQELLNGNKRDPVEVKLETIPMIVPTAVVPNDPHFPLQWDMTQIGAAGPGSTGWDISMGANSVVICILDEGCDLSHPDLQFAAPGINLGTMMPDGSPTGPHGTACAGIAAASINNGAGVAGVAGICRILPVAFDNWSDVEVAAGINYAAANGARVISMSFGYDGWDHAIIDPAIQNAFNLNVVMCVCTQNFNGPITYPATNPLVMACGASDQDDNRKSWNGDPLDWGSNFGPRMSVVAPGVNCPTTDQQGPAGYNPGGDYNFDFGGTSAATPHVAGLAALLISVSGSLTNVQVRNIIEQTADKVGTVPYLPTTGYPNGAWNQQMGYGRINVRSALMAANLPKPFNEFLFDRPDKNWVPELKRDLRKQRQPIDEVNIGYANPELLDPLILQRILMRLNRLEAEISQGRATAQAEPNVGQQVGGRPRGLRTPRTKRK